MSSDRETKVQLLASARKEFTEKGFMQASLRTICQNAGVTTGALYFFFQDKEDLFASLVEEPLNKLLEMMKSHYESEIIQLEEGTLISRPDFTDDIEVSKQIIHFMFLYRDEFQLILTKGQGSRFEHSLELFVKITEKHFRIIADEMARLAGKDSLDDFLIHWIAHMCVEMFVHLLTHEENVETAEQHIEVLLKFVVSGWFGMFS